MSDLIVNNFEYNGRLIQTRPDGFVNLTQMCQANGKRIDNWTRLKQTQDYISVLRNSLTSEVVQSEEGVSGGTWGHPTLAINLARWISPEFAVWCDNHIFNLMETGKTSIADTPPPEPVRVLPPERDAVDFANAAHTIEGLKDGLLKQLLRNALIDQVELHQNLKYLPVAEKPVKYTIAKVRARELGFSEKIIGDGTKLGKFIKSQIEPVFQERIGQYLVYHYEVTEELDKAIRVFFS